jgi:excinuclease ABC subunit C
MSLIENHKGILSSLPDNPGVYQFMDATGKVLYIGKAKNLKKRITSYFAGNQSGKTTVMLRKATDIRHIVVENESDALLLENNLIKKHQPRYNILLKDDKNLPWICIIKEPYPNTADAYKAIVQTEKLFAQPHTIKYSSRKIQGMP